MKFKFIHDICGGIYYMLLKQGYVAPKWKWSLSAFCSRYHELVDRFSNGNGLFSILRRLFLDELKGLIENNKIIIF